MVIAMIIANWSFPSGRQIIWISILDNSVASLVGSPTGQVAVGSKLKLLIEVLCGFFDWSDRIWPEPFDEASI